MLSTALPADSPSKSSVCHCVSLHYCCDRAADESLWPRYYIRVPPKDKHLLLYTLLKLKVIPGKALIFVNDVEGCAPPPSLLPSFPPSLLPSLTRCKQVLQAEALPGPVRDRGGGPRLTGPPPPQPPFLTPAASVSVSLSVGCVSVHSCRTIRACRSLRRSTKEFSTI